jgi:hypothetical protein
LPEKKIVTAYKAHQVELSVCYVATAQGTKTGQKLRNHYVTLSEQENCELNFKKGNLM